VRVPEEALAPRLAEPTDIYSPAKRSEIMSRVPSQGTVPEMRVRRALHRLGFRFRLHRRDLPGSPDLVLPKHRVVVFVHGCFWHQHPGCKKATVPKQNRKFWIAKLARNCQRDQEVEAALIALGWRVITVWECEIRHSDNWLSELKAIVTRTNVTGPDGACGPIKASAPQRRPPTN
jgi:DNA mismatch endonuclease (patch repair protein)